MRPHDRIYELPDGTPLERCTLYLREGGRFELDRHTQTESGGTRTTLKGSFEQCGELVTLRPEQRIALEEDPTGNPQELARTAGPEVLLARIQEEGAEVAVEFPGVTLTLARLAPRSRSSAVQPAAG